VTLIPTDSVAEQVEKENRDGTGLSKFTWKTTVKWQVGIV